MITLREHVKTSVGSFLYSEGFPTSDEMPECILAMLDMISDYSEEGKVLFPELAITNNIAYIAKVIQSIHIEINDVTFNANAFRKALKQCAPLAGQEWVVYINVKDNSMSYGLITTELTETSIALQKQLINPQTPALEGISLAFIKKKGIKSVELQGFKNTLTVDFSLKDISLSPTDCVHELCSSFALGIDSQNLIDYLEKIISHSLKESHGALLGIVEDEGIENLKSKIPDGVYLKNKIDINNLLKINTEENSPQSAASLRLYAKALQGMICSDGITVISTSGKVVGYNLFIEKSSQPITIESTTESSGNVKVVGGSRTRAFEYMIKSLCFKAVFFKSQDGEEKIFKNE